jgi:5'-nucleotidase (lipoprotein e(P4) family)
MTVLRSGFFERADLSGFTSGLTKSVLMAYLFHDSRITYREGMEVRVMNWDPGQGRLFLFWILPVLCCMACVHNEKTAGSDRNDPGAHRSSPSLYADLWVQTSAEYRALCHQVYRQGLETVREKVLKAQEGPGDGRKVNPVAVVMDLDETVLDNSLYQTFLMDSGHRYTIGSWDEFVCREAERIGLVPGAGEFIDACRDLGVEVIFISNRREVNRPATLKTLDHHGLYVEGMEDPLNMKLLLKSVTSSKSPRRQAVEDRYQVIAYFGDNLAGFDDRYIPKDHDLPTDRATGVLEDIERWGNDWFVLPNPVHGYWLNLIDLEHPGNVMNR